MLQLLDSAQCSDEVNSMLGSDNGVGQKLNSHVQGIKESGGSGDIRSFSLIFCDEKSSMPKESLINIKPETLRAEPYGERLVCASPDEKSRKPEERLLDIKPEMLLVEPKGERLCASTSASLQLLADYGSRLKRFIGNRVILPSHETECTETSDQKLSTNAIILFAAEQFIQSQTSNNNEFTQLPASSGTFPGLSEEETRDVTLVFYLLAAADKVGVKQFHPARKFLEQCDELISYEGDPVQRLGYYFSEALQKKINQETGTIASMNMGEKDLLDIEEALMSPNPTVLAVYKAIPLGYIAQFAGFQAIIEHVGEARKIHIIDLAIRNGMQLTILMQALAERKDCPLERLRITAIGTKMKPKLEETGSRLRSFAQSLGLPFSFNLVMVEDILHLNESHLSVENDEVVVVCSSFFLRTLVGQPDRLESLMRVIRNIEPCIMIVDEVEANHNSPVFVNRFIEALFYFGAYFDSLEDCMKQDEANRLNEESYYFSKGIHNIVAAEGVERTFRHVTIQVWRAFFKRFGIVEAKLSSSSMYQAKLLLNKFPCGNSCTFYLDGECLVLGWKETPLSSLSVWRCV